MSDYVRIKIYRLGAYYLKILQKFFILVVNKTMMSPEFLGRDLSHELLEEIEKTGADVCGENGEYHTVVYDGPLFKTPLNLNFSKEVKDIKGKWAKIDVLI